MFANDAAAAAAAGSVDAAVATTPQTTSLSTSFSEKSLGVCARFTGYLRKRIRKISIICKPWYVVPSLFSPHELPLLLPDRAYVCCQHAELQRVLCDCEAVRLTQVVRDERAEDAQNLFRRAGQCVRACEPVSERVLVAG